MRFHTYWAPWEGQNQALAHSPTPQAQPCCTPCTHEPPSPGAWPATPAPDSACPSGLLSDWHHLGIQGLGSPQETCTFGLHPGSPGVRIRAGGIGAWLALYSSHTAPTSPTRSVGWSVPTSYMVPPHHTYTHTKPWRPQRPQGWRLPGTVLRVCPTTGAQPCPVPNMSHINIHVVDQLCGDVLAAIRLCIGRQVSV